MGENYNGATGLGGSSIVGNKVSLGGVGGVDISQNFVRTFTVNRTYVVEVVIFRLKSRISQVVIDYIFHSVFFKAVYVEKTRPKPKDFGTSRVDIVNDTAFIYFEEFSESEKENEPI